MKVALRDFRGKYLTTWDTVQGEHPVLANRDHVGDGETFTLEILDGSFPDPPGPPTPPTPPGPGPVPGADMIDVLAANINHSPSDISDWPITVKITKIDETPAGGYVLHFDRQLPDRWISVPADDPTFKIQYTVWAFILWNGRMQGAGFVNMWKGREMGDGSLPSMFAGTPPGYTNWWGDPRKPWGEMSNYVPRAIDRVGFMVSAGDARFKSAVTSVRERSNVVTVPFVANDTGSWSF